MAHIYRSIDELIGKTPLFEVANIEKKLGLNAKILVKLESFNPAGSAKDRVALSIIEDAENRGIIKPGQGTIIEPTSGNTGIGISALAASRGYKAIIVMPDSMSLERQLLMKAYGAELVLTDGSLGMAGAIEKAKQLQLETPGSIIAGQFTNPANNEAHYTTTGPEIWDDTDGHIDAFVAGIGTGGTITGTGHYLRQMNSSIKIVAFEPAASPYLSEGKTGKHDLQGIGAGFVPEILDTDVYDELVTITDEEAYEAGRMLARCEGLLCGITSGGALACALKLAARKDFCGKTIVALLPDTGERYLSTKMFNQ